MRRDDPRQHADHFIYIAYRDDEPLYVGCTSDPEQRLKTWQYERYGWWEDATHIDVWEAGPGRDSAFDVERETIVALDPKHNRQWSPRRDREQELWLAYSEWAEAYRRYFYDMAGNAWAIDQAVADERCAAVGLIAPRIDDSLIERREAMRQAVLAV